MIKYMPSRLESDMPAAGWLSNVLQVILAPSSLFWRVIPSLIIKQQVATLNTCHAVNYSIANDDLYYLIHFQFWIITHSRNLLDANQYILAINY